MANVLVEEGSLQAVADGLRYAGGTADTYTPAQMGPAVQGLKKTLVSKAITANGTYDPADDNADGYSGVTVNVSGVTPVAITPVNYPSSYLNSGDARLVINDTRMPMYSFIAIDMSLYAGKIITIKNTGNRNFFGFYSAVSDGTAQQIFTSRQSTNGTLSVSVDTYYPRNTAYRYLCYDYTSNNQSQGIPSVTVVNASDLVP